jgi:hypothetical protein
MIEWAKLVKSGKISVDWYRNKEIKKQAIENKQSKTRKWASQWLEKISH